MVDAVVSFAVEKLSDALIGETFFLLDVRRQVEGLRDELIRMQCFLRDADAKEQKGDDRVSNWIAEIRNVAYDAEDVIDTFKLKVDSTGRKTKGIKNFLTRKALMLKNLGHLHRVGNEIQAIQARLKAISDSRVTYGISDLGETSSSETNQRMIQHPLRNRYPHVEDNDVIGFEEYTRTLLTELMKDEEERRIISIIGVGGLGKTTLAKKIYRHDTLKGHFDCCGWSSISQQLNVKDVLGEIMKKCMSQQYHDESQMNEGDLKEKIYSYLQDKRYFIVLDDVWQVNHWKTLSPAFPTGKAGSKVLLTTRNKEVALHADPWSLHFEPQILNDDDSWQLLRKKVFPKNMTDTDCCCPSRLETLGREMVRKCGGLPLGICVLGGLLATKKSEIKQWELVHRDVVSYINNEKNGGVNGILALSYHDLPSHLKPCFLYLGLFPEDYAIPRKKLIQLWIAEGFISHTEENMQVTLEDIGKHQYLAELIQRCMVQAGREPFFSTEGRNHHTCRVHDLMRDLCLSKGKEINFIDIYSQQHRVDNVLASNSLITNAYGRLRRCAINFNDDDYSKRYDICFTNSDNALRTLLAVFPWGSTRALSYQNVKLLRVLDLQNKEQFNTSMTKEVSKLIHLRYLGIQNVFEVSSSLGNLRNLQILKLGTSGSLPETAAKLTHLRHLVLSRTQVAQNFQIENLENLQTIVIGAGKWIRKGCLAKLSNLRKLDVWHASRLQSDIILQEIVGKRSAQSSDGQYQNPIRSLCIYTTEGFPNLLFDSLSCCHNLHTLHLTGKLDIVHLQKYPPNLTKLTLYHSSFTEDPMSTLQYLPKLKILNLYSSQYEGEEMVCSSKGFPQLQYLCIYWLTNVKEWRIDQGGMPRLKELHLNYCLKLSMLPEGLKFITTLKKLIIEDMPLITERVAEGVGEDWYKVLHVPSITEGWVP